MSRLQSPATERLLDAVREQGVDVSPRQLERWRQHGLVPGPTRTWLGRGRGSTSQYGPDAIDAVVAAAGAVSRYRSLDEALLALFVEGLPVDEEKVRQAYRDHYEGLADELSGSEETANDFDRADAAAQRLLPGLLRDPRGRAVRRRLRGQEERPEAVFASVATTILYGLLAGEPLGDDNLDELVRATGLDAIWTEDIAGLGPLADPVDAIDAMAAATDTMGLDEQIATVDEVDVEDLQEAARELRLLLCLCRDLVELALATGAAERSPLPSPGLDPDDPLAVARAAPAWLIMRGQLPAAAVDGASELPAEHELLHEFAEAARALPDDLRHFLTRDGRQELEGLAPNERQHIADRFQEIDLDLDELSMDTSSAGVSDVDGDEGTEARC